MSKYTDELADEICDRIASGESLRMICSGKNMPHRTTVLRWMDANEAFASKCARARELQAEAVHDQMIEIEDGVIDGAIAPDVARVVLSSKQWRAAKLAPKRYGDKVHAEHSGDVGLTINVVSFGDPDNP